MKIVAAFLLGAMLVMWIDIAKTYIRIDKELKKPQKKSND